MTRIRYFFQVPALVALMLAAAACGTKIPPEVAQKVSWHGDFKTLQADPEAYVGEFVILGGEILRTDNFQDSSEITVLQYPTGSSHRPRPEKQSGGRFLIRADTFLDPAIYKPGTLITVAGTITGTVKRAIDNYMYVHPVVKGELWVWEQPQDSRPRFLFGVGATF